MTESTSSPLDYGEPPEAPEGEPRPSGPENIPPPFNPQEPPDTPEGGPRPSGAEREYQLQRNKLLESLAERIDDIIISPHSLAEQITDRGLEHLFANRGAKPETPTEKLLILRQLVTSGLSSAGVDADGNQVYVNPTGVALSPKQETLLTKTSAEYWILPVDEKTRLTRVNNALNLDFSGPTDPARRLDMFEVRRIRDDWGERGKGWRHEMKITRTNGTREEEESWRLAGGDIIAPDRKVLNWAQREARARLQLDSELTFLQKHKDVVVEGTDASLRASAQRRAEIEAEVAYRGHIITPELQEEYIRLLNDEVKATLRAMMNSKQRRNDKRKERMADTETTPEFQRIYDIFLQEELVGLEPEFERLATIAQRNADANGTEVDTSLIRAMLERQARQNARRRAHSGEQPTEETPPEDTDAAEETGATNGTEPEEEEVPQPDPEEEPVPEPEPTENEGEEGAAQETDEEREAREARERELRAKFEEMLDAEFTLMKKQGMLPLDAEKFKKEMKETVDNGHATAPLMISIFSEINQLREEGLSDTKVKRRLSMKYHTDAANNTDPDAKEKFNYINRRFL